MALIDKASLLMVPSTYEDGTLYNILPSGNKAPDETGNHNGYDQTRADFTFSRGSNLAATRVNANGLIEKGRENLLLQSNAFDTTWINANSTETSGQADKDGGTNAWKIDITGVGGRIYQSKSQSGVVTFSVYAKKGTLDWVILSSNVTDASFNLATGEKGTLVSGIDSNIEAVGETGWYRCSFTGNGSFTQFRIYPAIADNTFTASSGNIYIQDAQAETSLVATDYIETGATTATAGVLENTPRIDYSSGAGALLLEPQRTNLIPQSEYIGGSFTAVNGSISANYGVSPDSFINSTRIQCNNTTDAHIYHAPSSLIAGTTYRFSCYYKGTAGEKIYIRSIGQGTGAASDGKIVTFTGDWQREDISLTHGTSASYVYIHDARAGGSTATDFECYGAQLEAGSYVSSYVPTYGSAATRGADSCSVTGVSDVIGQTEGTLYAEVEKFADGYWYLTISDGTSSNWIFIGEDQGKMRGYVRTSAGVQTDNRSADLSVGVHKMAIAYKLNDVAIYLDGAQVFTDSAADMPTLLDKISLTAAAAGVPASQTLKGALKQYALFNERLSNTELAALTA